MREKGAIGIILLIIVVLGIGLIGGWFLFGMKEKVEMSKSLEPDTSPSTDTQTLESPGSKIVEKGLNIDMEIKPAINNTISGIVNISATSVPENTAHVGFVVVEKLEDFGTNGTNLGIDSDGSNGCTRILDTTDYENGLYFVVSIASSEIGADPIGSANVQVEIKN